MALPQVPRRLITTEAPRDRVTPEAAGAPFRFLADGLDKLGDGLEDAGVVIAAEQGLQAVQTDADGKVTFSPMPNFTGRAGAAYNRAAQNRYLAEISPSIDAEVLKARNEHAGNPEGFLQWTKAFVDRISGNAPNPVLQGAVRNAALQATTTAQHGLTTQKFNLDIAEGKKAMAARMNALDDRMAALARQGGTDTPEYKAAQADYDAIKGELTKNPLYGYSAEVAELAQKNMQAKHTVEAAIGAMDGVFNKKGKDEARKYIEAIAWDPSLNLDPKERTAFVSRALARLEYRSAEGNAEVAAFRTETTEWVKLLESGAQFDVRAQEEKKARAMQIGDHTSYLKLQAAEFANAHLRAFRAAPDSEKPALIRAMGSNLNLSQGQRGVSSAIEAAAVAAGLDPVVAKMIAYRESAFAPTAVPMKRDEATGKLVPASTARGIFQLDAEQRARYGVQEGDTVENQIRGGIQSVKDRIVELKGALGRDPTPAEIYMAHFQGTGGASAILKADPNASLIGVLNGVKPGWKDKFGRSWGQAVVAANPWMANTPTAGSFRARIEQMTNEGIQRSGGVVPHNPYIEASRAELTRRYAEDMSKGLDRMVDGYIEATKKGVAITADDFNQISDWVQISGNFAAGKKIADHLTSHEGGKLIAGLPEPQRAFLLRSLQQKAETQGASRAEIAVVQAAQEQIVKGAEELQKNPHVEASRRGFTESQPALDITDPNAVAAALGVRQQTARVIQSQNPNHGPVQALDEDEIKRLAPLLTNGDADKAVAVLSTLQARTDPSMFAQTISQPEFKTALDGMIKSGDTKRMSAAFTALDVAYRTNPQQFDATFGKALYSKLSVWQANLAYQTPDQIADQMRKANDPAFATARAQVVTQMRDEAKKISDSDLLNAFGTKFLGVTWTAPSAPQNPVTAQIFRAEFTDLYSELRADGVDHDNAFKRAIEWQGRVWGPSGANDNRLMRRPPESWAPAVNGSHAWMKGEVETEIERILGPQYGVEASGSNVLRLATAQVPLATPNWQYSLVADPQTEGEIARFNQWKAANPGKTPPAELWPSYQLFVTDKDSRSISLWRDLSTEPMPLSAPVIPQPVKTPRFKWSDTAIRSRETIFENMFQTNRGVEAQPNPFRLGPQSIMR